MIQDLYVLMITAAVVSILFKLLKQPVVLGYIVAGVLIGPHLFGKTLVNPDNVKQWGDIGVLFVLFCIGLEISSEEPHQQRQGGSNRLVDNHRRHDAPWLRCGKGC